MPAITMFFLFVACWKNSINRNLIENKHFTGQAKLRVENYETHR